MNDKEEHTITENITPLQKNIAFRLLMWALVPILAAIGWQLGHAYSQTLDNEYVVDSKILVTNPHIEDDNENSRLTALGRTRDDTVLLGEATNSEEFHQRLSQRSGVNAALFEITGTATRTTRVVTIRVSSKPPEISSAVSSAAFDTLEQYLQDHRGALYLDTGLLFINSESIAAFKSGAGADWRLSGLVLGMLLGITLVAISSRWTMERREDE